MNPSDLTADLPAPREDEPSTLRADIADELADHLACAVRREELVGWAVPTNPSDTDDDRWAQPTLQRVLARFGDPRAIARKLWWDAMRERIMKERLLIGLTVVAVLACCGMAGLMWQMQAAQRDLLAESQAQNEKLLEQIQAALEKLQAAPADAAPSEWNQLTVKCTLDTADGPPAAGVKIQLQSASENTKGIPAIDATTGADGIADFGKVLYGSYRLWFRAPNGMERMDIVSVIPGRAKQATMVCPGGDGLTAITPRLVPNPSDPPPPELADQLWYWVTLVRVERQNFWSRRPRGDELIRWVVGPQGQLLDGTKLEFSAGQQISVGGLEWVLPRSAIPAAPLSEFVYSDIMLPSNIGTAPLMVEPGNYAVSGVRACLMSAETSDGTRLLGLLPPQRLADSRRSQAGAFGGYNDPQTKAEQAPDFAVVYGRPGTVDVPLRETRFDYMRRVLAAAPEYVPLRLSVTARNPWVPALLGRGRRTTPQDIEQLRASFRFLGAPSDTYLLTGVEVLAWEASEPTFRRRGSPDQSLDNAVRLVVLVTPEERDTLQSHEKRIEVEAASPETPRTSLNREAVRELEKWLEAKPEETSETPTENPERDGSCGE